MGLRGEVILLALMVVLSLSAPLEAQLRYGYYSKTCPRAESIVRNEVEKGLRKNLGLAAGLVRMHFHDCFVRGCDGSVLIDSTPGNTAEKDSPANNPSLRGFEIIDNVKAKLEATCKGVVSCADILSFAARDSVAMTGGYEYKVRSGRRDGRASLASETLTNLPPPTFDLNQLTQMFANKGLSQDEMITLSGAHTIGRSHCTSFSNRLYSFNSTVSQDPSLDSKYAAQLKKKCPQGSNDASLVVPMDPPSPNSLDGNYYREILRNRGLFTSDQALVSDKKIASVVWQNAFNNHNWKKKFARAMVKMGEIDVITGTNGEIHRSCKAIN